MSNLKDIPHPDPFLLFRQLYPEAVDSDISDPTIMSLATSDTDGKPSVRIVLLKEFDERGFVFYSNYEGRINIFHTPEGSSVGSLGLEAKPGG